MNFRPANITDARLLLDWRNDPATRANSINTDEVAFDAHMAWLHKSLRRPDRKMLIAEIEGAPVGTVRFDLTSEGWEVSWTVAPDRRGLGIGAQMVREAIADLSGPFIARIKPTNKASARIAERAGFAYAGESEGLGLWCHH